MILFVNNAAKRLPAEDHSFVGDFVSPRARRLYGRTPQWAADNDAYSGFDEDRYVQLLDAATAAANKPVFVTLPDQVADHAGTLHLFHRWHRDLAARGLSRAFALQNGIEDWKQVPWDYIEAVFIGGDNAFKLGPTAHHLCAYARHMRKWIHMGRVNSIRRLNHALTMGCDSCDGSGMARFPQSVLVPMIRHLHRRRTQLTFDL